jgi:hypothetical protein
MKTPFAKIDESEKLKTRKRIKSRSEKETKSREISRDNIED